MNKKVTIIGAGIAGLATASYLSKAGYDVTIFEKNDQIGGRGRKFDAEGFVFDMGPSWYWMPEIFEEFYNDFGYTSKDFYELKRLSPSYRIFWEDQTQDDIPSDLKEMFAWFEQLEPGSSKNLAKFLDEAKYKYEVGMNDLVRKPSLKWSEFLDLRIAKGLFKLHMLQPFSKYIRKYFKHPKILSLLEFPVLFLGAMPKNTPALYSLMNYADMSLGTWYPQGGMHLMFGAFEKIALEQGVKIIKNAEVTDLKVNSKQKIDAVQVNGKTWNDTSVLVSGADYAFTDKVLLKNNANYTDAYWDKRKMAPSSLIFYLGVDAKVDNLLHHNLFFDKDFNQHASEIYEDIKWPSAPLFYVSCPSKTDVTVAPEGKENLFILIPIATDLEDNETLRETYYNMVMDRLEERTKCAIREKVIYKRSYCVNDFKADYHAFKGNAYGLANTLKQTAILKPSMKHKKINNLYYTGQLTVPGPGVPPAIISGKIVANQVVLEDK
jgi:phytoene desaturase